MCLVSCVTTLGSLRSLSGDLALLAGSFFALLAVMIVLGRKWNALERMRQLPRPLYIAWRTSRVWGGLPGVSRIVKRVLPVLVAFFLGYEAHSIRQYEHTETYRIHIIRAIEPFRYLVSVSDGKPFVMDVCHNIPDPQFESGETDDVTFEQQSTCSSFAGEQFGWQVVRDEQGNIIHEGGVQ